MLCERKRAVRDGLTRYWNTLAGELGTDHDGRIIHDEYQACVLSPERFSGAIDELAAGFVRLGDLDGSGTATRSVFIDMPGGRLRPAGHPRPLRRSRTR